MLAYGRTLRANRSVPPALSARCPRATALPRISPRPVTASAYAHAAPGHPHLRARGALRRGAYCAPGLSRAVLEKATARASPYADAVCRRIALKVSANVVGRRHLYLPPPVLVCRVPCAYRSRVRLCSGRHLPAFGGFAERTARTPTVPGARTRRRFVLRIRRRPPRRRPTAHFRRLRHTSHQHLRPQRRLHERVALRRHPGHFDPAYARRLRQAWPGCRRRVCYANTLVMRPEDGSHRRQDPLRASRGGGSHRRAMRSAPRESGMRPSSARSGSPLPESLRPGPVTSRPLPMFTPHAPATPDAAGLSTLRAVTPIALEGQSARQRSASAVCRLRRHLVAVAVPRVLRAALRKRGTATALHRRSVPQRVVRVRHRSGIRRLTAPRCRPRFHPARRRGQLPVPLRPERCALPGSAPLLRCSAYGLTRTVATLPLDAAGGPGNAVSPRQVFPPAPPFPGVPPSSKESGRGANLPGGQQHGGLYGAAGGLGPLVARRRAWPQALPRAAALQVAGCHSAALPPLCHRPPLGRARWSGTARGSGCRHRATPPWCSLRSRSRTSPLCATAPQGAGRVRFAAARRPSRVRAPAKQGAGAPPPRPPA